MVHRALQAYLTGQVEHARREHAFGELVEIGRHLTETEEAADDATQEARTILVLHLLRKRMGDELEGVVVSLTQFGASVHLPEYGVEGLIPREALGPDRWQFDEQNQCLIGRHTGALLRLAQPLRVRIVAVHAAAGQLDLAPARELIPKMPRPTQKQKAQRKRRRTRKKR
jgi:ribonuclease R